MINLITEKTKEYLSVPSVVGHEKAFMDYIAKDFESAGFNVFLHEGLISVQGQEPNSLIICAHLDRHGLISLGNDEFVYAAQYMKEIKYGESNISSRKQIENIAKRFEGEHIYAYNPETGEQITHGTIDACYPNMINNDALFHVQGIKDLEQNIPLAYARQASYENGLLKGQIDNVISLAVVYALYQNGYQGTALLTCEEEIGKSWIHIADYLNQMDIKTSRLIVLDTSPYNEEEIIEKGPIILRNRDKSEIFNAELVNQLKARCNSLSLPFEVKDEMLLARGKDISDLGSTELGRLVHETNGRWSGVTVQIPTLMYHTSNETTTTKAITHFYNFLHNILIEDKI
jgi:putative aminopeptidase FrvX